MEIAEDWLKNFGQETTRGNYRSHLKKFREFIGQSLEDYFDSVDEGKFQEDFKEFVKHRIEDDGLSKSSITVMASAIKMFVNEATDIEFNEEAWQKFHRRYVKSKAKEGTRDRAGDKNEWQLILRNMNLKGRSLFLFLLSSGCRIGEALALEKKNIELEGNPPEAFLESETTKNRKERTVYFTQEAKDEIKRWLNYRENLTKKVRGELTKREKEELTEEEQEERKKELIAKRDDYENSERVWPFSYSTAWNILNGALEKAGLKDSDEETGWKDIRIHSTRKYFRTNCQLSADVRNCLMGHNSGLDKSYRRIEETGRPEEEYLKHMHNLTFFEQETATKEDLQKERRLIQYDMLMSEAKRKGVPKEKLSAYESKFREMEKIAQSTDINPDELIGDIDVVSEQAQALEEMAKSSEAPRTHREKIEVSFPEDVRSELFNKWTEHVRDLVEAEGQKSKQKVVDEGEVEEYLEEGWRFVNKLNDNEVVIEK